MSNQLYCSYDNCRVTTFRTHAADSHLCPSCGHDGVPVVEEVPQDHQLRVLKGKYEVLEHRFEVANMEVNHLNKMLEIEEAHSEAIQQQFDRAIEINKDLLEDYKRALNGSLECQQS